MTKIRGICEQRSDDSVKVNARGRFKPAFEVILGVAVA